MTENGGDFTYTIDEGPAKGEVPETNNNKLTIYTTMFRFLEKTAVTIAENSGSLLLFLLGGSDN